jgi:DNA (cytosine-5)-methyltransferase 1
MLTVLDLCSGIGGFALGLERTGGFRTVAFCEANQFCVEVLQSHWPDVPVFRDLRKLRGWHVGYVDCITAGFPCQPHSLAGRQEGPADPRDLWPDVFRVVREIMPEWFIGENVPGLDGKHMALDRVLIDLESAGYSAITIEIPACAVDAPHIRKRLFIVANRNGARPLPRTHAAQSQFPPAHRGGDMGNGALPGCAGVGLSDRPTHRQAHLDAQWTGAEWLDCPDGKRRRVKPGIRLLAHGVSRRVDQIRAYGNAVCPPLITKIGEAINASRL